MHKILMLVLFLAGTIPQLCAQHDYSTVSLAFTNENIALPFTRKVKSPAHPGVALGVEIPWRQMNQSELRWRGTLGAYFHEKVQHAVYAKAGLAYRYYLPFHIQVDAGADMGYAHSFYPSAIYEQTDDGGFEPVDQSGRPHAIASLGLGIGYDVLQNEERPLLVFLRYEMMVQTPFAVTIPVIPHTFFHLGVQYALF
jgi:hypothetical protein